MSTTESPHPRGPGQAPPEPPTAHDPALRAPPRKPVPLEVDPGASLGELIDAVLESCLAHFLANRLAARSSDDPEGVHQLRVAVRRTRSALAVFRPALAREATRRLRDELRWLGGALSPARDQDVFCLEILAAVRQALPEDPGLRRLCWEAELQRLAAHGTACAALDSDRFLHLELLLDRYVRGGEWRHGLGPKQARRLERPARKPAAKRLDRLFGEVRLLERPFVQLDADELHALRIRVKRLRYASELLAPLHPGRPARRFTRRLRALQDALGRINDGRVADGLVAALLGRIDDVPTRTRLEHAAGLVSGWSHAHAALERRAVEPTWRRVAGATPFWR